MTLTIGLTGGIGSGKSAASQYFAKLGAQIIDTDVIARSLTDRGQPALEKIRANFTGDLFDSEGALVRNKMRALIFSDARAKTELEAILHPLIKQEVMQALSVSTTTYQMLVVPLLLETNDYLKLISRTLVVDCDEETQRQRAMAYHKLSRAEVDAIMATQLPRAQRLKFADDILGNYTDIAGLHLEITSLHKKYMQLSTAVTNHNALTHE